MIRLGILADYNPQYETHSATDKSLELAASKLDIEISPEWLPTKTLGGVDLESFDALIAGTGIYEDRSRVVNALRIAREKRIPLLASCGGFQFMIIEYARNVLGLGEVGHQEFDAATKPHIIIPLQCSLRGLEGSISIEPNSQVGELYRTERSTERFYCAFGINPLYVDELRRSDLRVVGTDDEGLIRVTELPQHPFFIGTLFVPQAASLKGVSHPLVEGLLVAAHSRQRQRI
jgi:CTP synthase (UTP-ammonia lyase)